MRNAHRLRRWGRRAGNRKPESRIDWSFGETGTYYLEVGARNRGPGTGYSLGLSPGKGRVK